MVSRKAMTTCSTDSAETTCSYSISGEDVTERQVAYMLMGIRPEKNQIMMTTSEKTEAKADTMNRIQNGILSL